MDTIEIIIICAVAFIGLLQFIVNQLDKRMARYRFSALYKQCWEQVDRYRKNIIRMDTTEDAREHYECMMQAYLTIIDAMETDAKNNDIKLYSMYKDIKGGK